MKRGIVALTSVANKSKTVYCEFDSSHFLNLISLRLKTLQMPIIYEMASGALPQSWMTPWEMPLSADDSVDLFIMII